MLEQNSYSVYSIVPDNKSVFLLAKPVTPAFASLEKGTVSFGSGSSRVEAAVGTEPSVELGCSLLFFTPRGLPIFEVSGGFA